MGYIVKTVDKDSIAEQVGIQPGDEVVDFNNQPFIDIIDFYFFVSKQRFSVGYINASGESVKAKIQKLPEEDLESLLRKIFWATRGIAVTIVFFAL